MLINGLLPLFMNKFMNAGRKGYRFSLHPIQSTHNTLSSFNNQLKDKKNKLMKRIELINGGSSLRWGKTNPTKGAGMELIEELTKWNGPAERGLRPITHNKERKKSHPPRKTKTNQINFFIAFFSAMKVDCFV